jgi:hypothetical protein
LKPRIGELVEAAAYDVRDRDGTVVGWRWRFVEEDVEA